MADELSDAEVFGAQPQKQELSDADVFGSQPASAPPGQQQAQYVRQLAAEPAAAQELTQQFDQAHPVVAGAVNAIGEQISGLVPKSLQQAAELATPAVSGAEQAYQAAKNLYDVAIGGKSISEVSPQGRSFSEFTPYEWGQFGGTLAGQLAMAALIGHSMIPKGGGLAPVTESVVRSELERPPVQTAREPVPQNLQPKVEPYPSLLQSAEDARRAELSKPVSPEEMGATIGKNWRSTQQGGEPNASQIESTTTPDGGVRARSEVGQLPQGNVETADARLRSDQGIQPAEARTGTQAQPQVGGISEATKIQPDVVPSVLRGETTVYHSTPAKFEHFDARFENSLGTHFGTEEQANYVKSNISEGGRTIPAKIELKNPLVLDKDLVFTDAPTLVNQIRDAAGLTKDDISKLQPKLDAVKEAYSTARFDDDPKYVKAQKAAMQSVKELLQSKGYDGMVYPNFFERKGMQVPQMSYAVFDTSKIKQVKSSPVSGAGQAPAVSEQPKTVSPEASAATKPTAAIPAEAPAPKPPVQITSDTPQVSGISNRLAQARVARGEIGEIAPGQGTSVMELRQRGLQMSPEEVNQHVSDVMKGTGDIVKQGEALTAEEARLSERSTRLGKESDADPTNMDKKIAADNAFKDLTDFHNGPIATLKTRWSDAGKTLQGEIPVDLSTFNGLREAWLKDTGKAPPKSVEPILRNAAKNVSNAIEKENGVNNRLVDAIDKETAKRKLPTADEVRNNIRERMKNLPCPT